MPPTGVRVVPVAAHAVADDGRQQALDGGQDRHGQGGGQQRHDEIRAKERQVQGRKSRRDPAEARSDRFDGKVESGDGCRPAKQRNNLTGDTPQQTRGQDDGGK
jgi:hypothetical protein